MAFGKKSAEIARLHGELAAAQAEIAAVRPYAPIVKAAIAAVNQEIEDGTITGEAYTASLRAVSHEIRVETVVRMMATMKPIEKLDLVDRVIHTEANTQ